jgi:hypothetical protein
MLKRERTKVVRASETFQVLVTHAPNIPTKLHRVPAFDPGEIVRELDGLRFGDAILISTDNRIVSRIIAEIEDWERAGRRMVAGIQSGQAQSRDRTRALNGKLYLQLPQGKAEADFVHEIIRDQKVVRNDEVVVVLGVLIRRQEIVHRAQRGIRQGLRDQFLPTPPHEHGLL